MSELVNKGKSVYEITVEADQNEWKKAQEQSLNKLAKEVEVKGFRKGKAPLNLAKERISAGQIFEEAMNIVLPKMFEKVVKDNNLTPYLRPDVVPTKVSDTQFEAKFTIVCMPEVELGKYKQLGVKVDVEKVTADEINHEIDTLLDQNSEWNLKEADEVSCMGDTVILDFKGMVDGKEFEGGSAENYSLVLGSNQFVPGFEEQLVGVKSETEVEVKVTFPEKYVANLAGKEAVFACKVHEIKSKKLPELNDEFVKTLKIENVETVDQLKDFEEKHLKEHKENDATSKKILAIIDKIIEKSKFTIADQILEAEKNSVKENIKAQIEQNGLTFEQYKEITGLTDEKLDEQYQQEADTRLKRFLVMNEISVLEKITVEKQDIEDYYAQIAAQYNMKVEDVKKALAAQENRMAQELMSKKIQDFLLANNEKSKE